MSRRPLPPTPPPPPPPPPPCCGGSGAVITTATPTASAPTITIARRRPTKVRNCHSEPPRPILTHKPAPRCEDAQPTGRVTVRSVFPSPRPSRRRTKKDIKYLRMRKSSLEHLLERVRAVRATVLRPMRPASILPELDGGRDDI